MSASVQRVASQRTHMARVPIVESSGIIYDANKAAADRRIAFFPSLCPVSNGSILAGR